MKAIDNPARVVKSRKNFGIGIGIRTSGLSGLAVSGLANKFVSEKKKFFLRTFLAKKKFFLQKFLCTKKCFFALFLRQKMALFAIFYSDKQYCCEKVNICRIFEFFLLFFEFFLGSIPKKKFRKSPKSNPEKRSGSGSAQSRLFSGFGIGIDNPAQQQQQQTGILVVGH